MFQGKGFREAPRVLAFHVPRQPIKLERRFLFSFLPPFHCLPSVYVLEWDALELILPIRDAYRHVPAASLHDTSVFSKLRPRFMLEAAGLAYYLDRIPALCETKNETRLPPTPYTDQTITPRSDSFHVFLHAILIAQK